MKQLAKTQFTENFWLHEFVKTATGLDNIPGTEEIENLRRLCDVVLQPLRDYLVQKYPDLKIQIIITSGFRSLLVNRAIGGSDTSDHVFGRAADFIVPGLTNQQIIDAINELGLPFDQVIDEQLWKKDTFGKWYLSKWIHVGLRDVGKNRFMVMIARNTKEVTKTVYTTISKA